MLIIKIIKIKLFWLLPIVIGVGAAKKLLLKFLLFLFPALTHLFKLCSYYQQSYHGTKYHHHHHLINHHHTVGATVRDSSLPPTLTLSNSLASLLVFHFLLLCRARIWFCRIFLFSVLFSLKCQRAPWRISLKTKEAEFLFQPNVCGFVSLSFCLSDCLCIYLSVSLSVCVSIYMSLCLSTSP